MKNDVVENNNLNKPKSLEVIKRYPFHGRTKYLIDKFYYIGYSNDMQHKLLIKSPIKDLIKTLNNKNTFDSDFNNLLGVGPSKKGNSEFKPFYLPKNPPNLMNEFTSDESKVLLKYDLIQSLIFPKGCQFFYVVKNFKKEKDSSKNKDEYKFLKKNKPESYNVTFSSNPQEGNNSKKSLFGYAFVYYKLFSEMKAVDNKGYYFYVPYTFCILSEYPFFSSYYHLCNQIYKLMNQKTEIPLEIIIYNIVKYTSAPINNDVYLHLNAFNSYNKDNDIIKSKKEFRAIKFEILSGYPLFQYNLAKVLLDTMSPGDVLTIFFYTFFEKSVIFFSRNIELLSLTINSYLNLNFPLNDEKYYFYNASISYENYMDGNSIFIGTTFTNAIGINEKYTDNYINNHIRLHEHLTVDLDKGVINQFEDQEENPMKEKDLVIFEFLQRIFKEKEYKEKDSLLYKEVKYVFDKLTFYKNLLKPQSKEPNEDIKRIKELKYIDCDDQEGEKGLIKKINRNIQEMFLSLVNNLCSYIYRNFSLNSQENLIDKVENAKKESMNVIFNENYSDNTNFTKTEKYLLDELRQTMKFQSFVYGFIQTYNPIDLYKIPLLFTEEFLSILINNYYTKNKDKIKFLALIDTLYKKNKSKQKYMNIDFGLFVNGFIERYKKKFEEKLLEEDDNDILDSNEQNSKNNSLLNNKIIKEYKKFLENLNKIDLELLLNDGFGINKIEIENIHKQKIVDSIEKVFINIELITDDEICYSNMLYLIIFSLKEVILKLDFHSFLNSLFEHCKVFRKYYTMVIEIIYKLLMNNIKNHHYNEAESYLMYYYQIINSLRSLKLIPNESIINLIKKFHQINIDDLRSKDEIKEENEIINENNNDEENKYNDNYIYIINNFNKTQFIKEQKIVKIINEMYKVDKKTECYLKYKNDKKLKPKIKFNNGVIKQEFDIYAQNKVLKQLNKEYINYLKNNLDYNSLNAKVVFNAFLNVVVYFRSIEDYEGKSKVELSLIEMYNFYLKLFEKNVINPKV